MNERTPAVIAFRVAMGVTFLSAVADRFGLWGPPGSPNAGWGNWERFVTYSSKLNWFLPDVLQQPAAVAATASELGFGLALIAGIRSRATAYGAAVLLTAFALAMSVAEGVKSPLAYSVWVDATGCWLLATTLGGLRAGQPTQSKR